MTYPTPSLKTDWVIDPKVYEDIVSVFLSYLHPDSIRVDGSGGDEGRDVYFGPPEALEIFELKSFHQRLGAPQRRQVKDSFKRALEHGPASWTVVCPIDLTPGERKWFEGLTKDVDAACSWFGKTWLDARAIEFPAVPRFYLTNVNDELIRLAELLHEEQAVLSQGIPEAIERVKALGARCDELDPFYRVGFAVDAVTGGVSTSLAPRYLGAERDRPIKLSLIVAFPDTPDGHSSREQFEDFIDYGVAVDVSPEFVEGLSVDAPAGLTEHLGPGLIQIKPEIVDATTHAFVLAVINEAGGLVASLAMTGSMTSQGQSGAIFELRDGAELVSVTLKFNVETKQSSSTITFTGRPCFPAMLLPSLRFMAALLPGRVVTLQVEGDPLGDATIQLDDPVGYKFDVPLRIAELLARVQDKTHTCFDMPGDLSDDDIHDLVVADRLLDGKIMTGTWESIDVHAPAESLSETAREFLGGQEARLLVRDEKVLEIGGHKMPLGEITTLRHSARVVNADELAEAIASGRGQEEFALIFAPASTNTLDTWLGSPEDRPANAEELNEP